MPTREAACHCGQLRLGVMGDPFVVSICHCLACQRRTASGFGMQAAFSPDQVHVAGRFNDYTRARVPAPPPRHSRRRVERLHGLLDAHPEQGVLYYNAACCESLAANAPTPSRTLRARSRSGTAAEGSPVTTPTSIRSDRSSLLRGSSTASPSGIAADRR